MLTTNKVPHRQPSKGREEIKEAAHKTEPKREEALLIQSKDRAEALIHIAARLNDQLDLERVLEVICEETAHALDVPVVSVYLSNEQDDSLSPARTIGLPPGAAERLPVIPQAQFQQLADRANGLIVIPDVVAGSDLPGADLMFELNFPSQISIGLQHKNRLIGCLNLAMRGEARQFTPEDFTLLQGLADQASKALVNARTFDQANIRLNRMMALRKIDIAIINSLDLHISIDVILEQVQEQMGVDAACLLQFYAPLQTLKFYAGRGFRTNTLQYTDLHIGKSYAGRAALEQRIIHISNLRSRQTGFLRSPTFANEGFISYYAVPLIAKGDLKGVLEIFHRAPLEYGKESLDFLETLAGQAAIAIDNNSMFVDLQRSNQDLIQAYDATIEGWSYALDLRDKETEGHTHRVTVLTLNLAQKMGVKESELIHIRRGALLHDIGKMGVPDSILHKPDLLSEEEMELMRKHPVFAYEMLAPIEYLKPALDIPHYHHEKWDGTGYPQGLKGTQIPFAARLFAVVDVWDALTAYRPYRNGWTQEETLVYIHQQAGKHFDPAVVNAFLEMIKDYQL